MDLKTSMALRNYGVNPGTQSKIQSPAPKGVDFTLGADITKSFGLKEGNADSFATPKKDFSEVMRAAATEALTSVQGAEKTAIDGVGGKTDAQSVAEAMADAEMTVRSVAAVRDKVVEAYQEILRMPI